MLIWFICLPHRFGKRSGGGGKLAYASLRDKLVSLEREKRSSEESSEISAAAANYLHSLIDSNGNNNNNKKNQSCLLFFHNCWFPMDF